LIGFAVVLFVFLEPSSVQAKFKNEVHGREHRHGRVSNNFSSGISLTVSSLAAIAVIASKTTPQYIYKMAGEREHFVVSHFRVGALRSR